MKLLVFGSTGQLARELRRLRPDAEFLGRAEADLAHPEACADAIRAARPDAVLNAAAYTQVDKAESDEDVATTINGASPAAMARAAAELLVPFLHVSTDYVFDGSGTRPWEPEDETAPLGAYGRSKRAGEIAIRAAGGQAAILRTSWVFSAHGANFVKTMLRLSSSRDSLSVVSDQIGGPTSAHDIASTLIAMASALRAGSGRPGTYHFSGAPDVSWADFAREIFRQAGRTTAVVDIPSQAYPTPARRPHNSRLDCRTTEAVFGIRRPDWRTSLTKVLKELGELA
jgi:dTDP-4-dehydrorhamnose reductase